MNHVWVVEVQYPDGTWKPKGYILPECVAAFKARRGAEREREVSAAQYHDTKYRVVRYDSRSVAPRQVGK